MSTMSNFKDLFNWDAKTKTELIPDILAYVFISWTLLKKKSSERGTNFYNQSNKKM